MERRLFDAKGSQLWKRKRQDYLALSLNFGILVFKRRLKFYCVGRDPGDAFHVLPCMLFAYPNALLRTKQGTTQNGRDVGFEYEMETRAREKQGRQSFPIHSRCNGTATCGKTAGLVVEVGSSTQRFG